MRGNVSFGWSGQSPYAPGFPLLSCEMPASSQASHSVAPRDAAPPVLRHQPHRARRRADERVLINVAGRDAGHDEPGAARDELDPLDRSFRIRIFPAPQVVSGRPSHGVLHQGTPASPQLPSKRGSLWSMVSVTARNGSRPHPGGTTWISNRSPIRAVTTSPPTR